MNLVFLAHKANLVSLILIPKRIGTYSCYLRHRKIYYFCKFCCKCELWEQKVFYPFKKLSGWLTKARHRKIYNFCKNCGWRVCQTKRGRRTDTAKLTIFVIFAIAEFESQDPKEEGQTPQKLLFKWKLRYQTCLRTKDRHRKNYKFCNFCYSRFCELRRKRGSSTAKLTIFVTFAAGGFIQNWNGRRTDIAKFTFFVSFAVVDCYRLHH